MRSLSRKYFSELWDSVDNLEMLLDQALEEIDFEKEKNQSFKAVMDAYLRVRNARLNVLKSGLAKGMTIL